MFCRSCRVTVRVVIGREKLRPCRCTRFPPLRSGLGGIFISGGGRVDGRSLTACLLRAAASRGATILQGHAAVAVDASHSATAALVRSRHWTIPIAYDLDGAVGTLYGVEICPLLELATRGGTVADRLIVTIDCEDTQGHLSGPLRVRDNCAARGQ